MANEIILNSHEEALKLLGRNGELRKRIQAETPVRIVDRGAKVMVMGEPDEAEMVSELLEEMLSAVRQGHTPTMSDLNYALSEARQRRTTDLGDVLSARPGILRAEMHIRPRTRGQQHYLEAIRTHDVTLGIGPAGTGKTFLAMAAAVSALMNKQVNRLVLCRPAVEAGESLGFLPGDLQEKVNPYLRPLYDALYAMVDADRIARFMDREMIEVAPLAFMRGRTLGNAFAILDEAQNTTTEQMKMFLTRLGEGSRAVITGDVTQIDLPRGTESGLVEAGRILHRTPGVAICRLTRDDVVRHPLVQNIIDAYESGENQQRESGASDETGDSG